VRLRRKITVAFFGVSSLVSVLLALFLYRFLERKLADDLHDRSMTSPTSVRTRSTYQRTVR